MSQVMKVLLVLAVMVCISKAQFHESGSQCLCQQLSLSNGSRTDIKDIQIYPATIFCDKVEILVTMKNGARYCLDTKLRTVKKFLSNVMRKQRTSAARRANLSSATDSTNTAHI